MSSLVIGPYDLLSNASLVRLAPDYDLGDPSVETQAVARLLFDGDIVTGVRSGNRDISLPLHIIGTSSTNRAAVIETLAAIVNSPFTMTWTPGDGLPVVFDCYRAQPIITYNSLYALQGLQDVTLKFQAQPYTRTPSAVSLAPTTSPSITVDAYDATTGLTFSNATGATATSPKVSGTNSVKLTFTIPAMTGSGTSGSPYVPGQVTVGVSKTISSLDLSTAATASLYAQAPGTDPTVGTSHTWQLTLSSSGGSKTWQVEATPFGDGFKFVTWNLANTPVASTGTFNQAAVTGYSWTFYTSNFSSTAYGVGMYVDQFAGYQGGGASNLTSAAGYVRFDGVRGSARSPVSFTIDAASAVSRVLLARSPNPPAGFNPILTPNSGTATADTNAISGSYYVGGVVYRVAATTVRGTYTLVARLQYSANQTITTTAQITGDTFTQTITTKVTTAASGYVLLPLGELTLPTRDVDGTNTAATVDITITNSGSIIQLDQVYLVDTAGESLLVDLGSGSARYWFLDAPTAGQFTSRVLAGSASDRSNAISVTPYLRGPAAFNFDPGTNNLLVVCDKATSAPTITCSYYPRSLYERSV